MSDTTKVNDGGNINKTIQNNYQNKGKKYNNRRFRRKWYTPKKKGVLSDKSKTTYKTNGESMRLFTKSGNYYLISNDNFLSMYRILGHENADKYFEEQENRGNLVYVLIGGYRMMDWRSSKAYYHVMLASFNKQSVMVR